jgi:hypothetical protein
MATHKLISSATVGSGGIATIVFTSIPQTYTDLLIKFSGRNVTNNFTFSVSINGTTVTSGKRLYGTGSGYGSDTYNGSYTNYLNAAANTFGNAEIYVPHYTATTAKTLLVDAVSEDNYVSAYMNFGAFILTSSSAVTSIGLIPESGNFAEHSTAYLYGISNA